MPSAVYMDISAHQLPSLIDWQQYKIWSAAADGTSRVCLRVSYSTNQPDVAFEQFYKDSKAAGIGQYIYYHYCQPDWNPGTAGAQAEAQFFLKTLAGRLGPTDYLMIDAEEPGGTADWFFTFATTLAQSGVPFSRIAVYSYGSYIKTVLNDSRFAAMPLILAYITGNADFRPSAPAPWSNILAIQYSWTLYPSGVNQPVDADVWTGNTTVGSSVGSYTTGTGTGDCAAQCAALAGTAAYDLCIAECSGIAAGTGGGSGNVFADIDALAKFFTDRKNWLRIALGAFGAVLIVAGLVLAGLILADKVQSNPLVQDAEKVGELAAA